MNITVKSAAKVNLSLDIVGVREDGYHLLKTVMQTVSLYDYIFMDTSKKGISISCNLPYVPCNEKNIVYKAASLFFSLINEEPHIRIGLEKHIPVCAGMGGGSSNAAAVLIGLNSLFGNPVPDSLLAQKSVELGADVPYFFYGGTKLCEGIGEIISEAPQMQRQPIVVLKDKGGVSTPLAFKSYDSNPVPTSYTKNMLNALKEGNESLFLGNALYDHSKDLCPQITKNINILKNNNAHAVMTGSGSAVFGIFESEEASKKCHREEKHRHENTVLCYPTDKAILIY